ncbi:class I SAM-dependent methyltransferase [Caulobacter sp. S45]|jgi:predicted methyltransferase|uniref:class I SAM-dependent methyltransferase n=1 Tax=Caulobacter sp. S45 TaxID=1641861 RepID=UPI00131A80BB|nr:methyltransferase [Caulobacter sp. S45]
MNIRILFASVMAVGLAGGALVQSSAAQRPMGAVPPYVLAAVADPQRPDKDRDRDVDRKPAPVVAFSGLKPGDTVVDLIPGGGYFTRIFSRVVGPAGKVYALVPASLAAVAPQAVTAAKAVGAEPAYANVTVLVEGVGQLSAHAPIDMVWTSQNYHDLHGPKLPPSTALDIDKAVFAALKPGGLYVIEDHAAEAGSGLRDAGTLHRIDVAAVRDEVTSVGFVLVGESPVLHNPADPHTARVFDPSIRGHTDQFLLKFRKPG